LFISCFVFVFVVGGVFSNYVWVQGIISILIGNFNKVENKIMIKMLSEDVTTALAGFLAVLHPDRI